MNLSKALNVTGWGLYCAVSWTWCIGMFLPVIMLARFGWAGFWVFAIPNVIGCAAFGYVLGTRERSRAVIEKHGVAATWFSVVTIAYHMFFIAWMGPRLIASTPPAAAGILIPIACVLGLTIIGWLLSRLPDHMQVVITCVVYVISFTTFTLLIRDRDWQFIASMDLGGLAFVAPIIVFGFALCPYLDLTFHRALQNSPHRSSFIVFGIAFAPMLLLTCFMWRVVEPVAWFASLIVCHIIAQMIATVALHFREIATQNAITCRKRKAGLMLVPLGAGVLYVLLATIADTLVSGEETYLRFLGCYGLVFPLYVWVFMTPFGVRMSRPNLLRFAGAVALCTPLYELGFVQQRFWVLAIPVAAFVMWPVMQIVQGRSVRIRDA